MKNIIFIGFKGCGKTTVGRGVAKRLNRDFLDSDAMLETLYFNKEGDRLPFREIFKKKGSDYFRSLELDVVKDLVHEQNKVISLGGGTLFLDSNMTEKLCKHKMVYLYVSPEDLFKRICTNGIPAIFRTESPHESFQKLLAEREPLFQKCGHVIFDNTSCSVAQAVDGVMKEME